MTWSILGVDPWIFLDRIGCQEWRNIARKFGATSLSAVHRPGIERRVVDTCLTCSLRNMHLEFDFTSLPALASSQCLDFLD